MSTTLLATYFFAFIKVKVAFSLLPLGFAHFLHNHTGDGELSNIIYITPVPVTLTKFLFIIRANLLLSKPLHSNQLDFKLLFFPL